MNKLIAIFLVSSCSAALADEEKNWHLLTQTQGGTMQLVKSLSKSECEFMLHRAKGEPATQQEIDAEKARKEKETAAAAEAKKISEAKEAAWRVARPECFPKDKDGKDKPQEYFNLPTDICQKRYEVGGYTVYGSSMRMISPGDIKSAECFQ